MAQLDFPNSPTLNQIFAAPNGATYKWDGTAWIVVTSGSPAGVYIGAAAPATPFTGELWWRSDPDQNLYLYYDDGNSKQFVNAVPSVSRPTGPAGGCLGGSYPNPTLVAGIQSYTRANRSTVQSIPSGATTYITFDGLWGADPAGMWSAGSPDRLTVKADGFYVFGGSFTYDSSAGGTRRMIMMVVSGTSYATNEVSPAAQRGVAITSAGYLTNGQFVQCGAYQDSGAALNVGNPVSLWIARIA
jgi:hypothetical protein